MKYVVTNATNYHILVGQQALHHLALVWIIGLKRHELDRDGLLVMA